jgi:alcohol dehydrogenase class IV
MLRLRLPLPRFLSAGEVFAGKGSLAALRGLDAVRAVVLCSRSMLRDPQMVKRITGAVNAHDVRLLEAPAGEPDLPKLQPVMREVAAFQPDWIIAIGGGSVLDAGKLLWIFHEHPDADLGRIARPFALPPLRGKCRFAAVPTTAGTGSEVSSSTILTDAAGRKLPIVSHDLLPDVAVLDPMLTLGVPPAVVASAGLDALAHALEGYVSRFANPLADTFAESAVRTLLAQLPATQARPDDADVRLEVMQAAMLAGWVQNLKVPGIGHAIAHQLGQFGLAHGAACGALLSPAIAFNVGDAAVRQKYDRLAAGLGLHDTTGLLAAISELRLKLGAGQGLGAAVPEGAPAIRARLPEITSGALADICARANPRALDAAAVEGVLAAAL